MQTRTLNYNRALGLPFNVGLGTNTVVRSPGSSQHAAGTPGSNSQHVAGAHTSSDEHAVMDAQGSSSRQAPSPNTSPATHSPMRMRQSPDTSVSIDAASKALYRLSGLWTGHYGPHGPEVLHIRSQLPSDGAITSLVTPLVTVRPILNATATV